MTWGALEGRLRMFSTEELESLDRSYFSVICADAYDVTIMSKNTGHVWYIHNPEYPEPGNCIIFHKHQASHPYHRHGRAGSLRQAVRSIQGHDRYQIEVREGGAGSGRKETGRAKGKAR